MAFKTVQDLGTDNVVALGGLNRKTGKKNPTQVEGYYLGSRKVESKKAKNGFAYIHVVQTPKGNVGIWGKTDLDRKIINVTPGTMIRATHVGMVATPNGEMYKYQVELDSDNTIEVTGSVQGAADNASESEDGDYENPHTGSSFSSAFSEDEEEEQQEEEEVVVAPAPRAVAQSPSDRSARLNSLLKSKKA